MTGDPHIGFIAAAYVIATLVVVVMVVAIVRDGRQLRRALARLGTDVDPRA